MERLKKTANVDLYPCPTNIHDRHMYKLLQTEISSPIQYVVFRVDEYLSTYFGMFLITFSTPQVCVSCASLCWQRPSSPTNQESKPLHQVLWMRQVVKTNYWRLVRHTFPLG